MTSLAASITPKASVFPLALVRLESRAQKDLWGLRLGRLYGFGIGLTYGSLALIGPDSLSTSSKLWARCLAIATWVAGFGALSLANDLSARDAAQGLTSLVRLRGFAEAELERARTVAGGFRLALSVLVPGLMVALAALLRLHTLHGAIVTVALACLTVPYALLVGGTLSVLARACSRWLPGRGRLLLLAIVLGPWLLALGLGVDVPSLPAAFAWLLEHLARSVR